MARIGTLSLLLVALLSAACAGTFGQVTPQTMGTPPAQPPKTLVVGAVGVSDAAWEQYRSHFKKGVADWVAKNGGVPSVVTGAAATPDADNLVLTGTLTEINKGSAAARFFVGMGAGQAKAKGDFELRRPDGTLLARFTVRRSYLGGVGIGGAGLLDMDELVGRLGEAVAETTVKWLRGEKVE